MNTAIIRIVVKGVVAASVGTVVGNAVRATTPVMVNRLDKILIPIGAFVLGGIAGERSADYIANMFFGQPKSETVVAHVVVTTSVDAEPEIIDAVEND